MKTALSVIAGCLAAASAALAVASAQVRAGGCADMAALALPDVVISAATPAPAGPFTAPGASKSVGDLPAFCRVSGTAAPTRDSKINFEVWTPAAGWNGKFLALGNNAFNGAISYEAMAAGLRRGYAVSSSDAGHVGGDLAFAVGHPEKVADWAWRANHVTSDAAKLVIRNLEGRFPDFSYFEGCDTGGHQALMQAQRFPGDYDGIVAGNPAANRTNEIIAYLRIWLDTHDAAGKALLDEASLKLLYAASMKACDRLDGLADGVIDDPRLCRFDPATLLCKDTKSEACLSAAQVAAASAVYADTVNKRTGQRLFSGWPPGSEFYGPDGSWASLVTGPQPRRVEFFRYFVFHDPSWDYRSFDFGRDADFVRQQAGSIDAVDPNLSAFAARHGKLIMYTGWADPILPAMEAIHYYDAVKARLGGEAQTSAFLRLYMVPGMGHCRGGPGASSFDMLSALERWVEKGEAPAAIPASRIEGGRTTRTRPLCPHPQVARWTGKGSGETAADFVCAAPNSKGTAP